MHYRNAKYLITLALAATAAVVSACSDTGTTEPTGYTTPRFNIADPGVPGQKVVLCKEGTSGTFEAKLEPNALGTLVVSNPFTVAAGECVDVWVGRTGQNDGPCCEPIDGVTITETSAVPVSIQYAAENGPCVATGVTANAVTVHVNTFSGCTVTFVNEPPPPPPGGDGCTPGFWKNSVGSWPAPYVPGADFDATFGVDIFSPNVSLLTAAGLGGGGRNAFARHAVAALLNSAAGDVDYGMTTAQVLAAVQAAAASGDFESTKNVFEGLNELECGLPNDNSF
jgi:hypothetical protein